MIVEFLFSCLKVSWLVLLVRLRSYVSATLADCLHSTHVIHGRGAHVRCPVSGVLPDSYDH